MEPETKKMLLKNRTPHTLRFTDPRTLNMEEYKGMGFDENNYSLILHWLVKYHQKASLLRPTSTPKQEDELILNRSDPTDNRGKINRVNSFEVAQE